MNQPSKETKMLLIQLMKKTSLQVILQKEKEVNENQNKVS
jgi:hypothetical protein